jgi:hypothetical protein
MAHGEPWLFCRMLKPAEALGSKGRGCCWCKFCTLLYSRACKHNAKEKGHSVPFKVDALRQCYRDPEHLDRTMLEHMLISEAEKQAFEAVVTATRSGLTHATLLDKRASSARGRELRALQEKHRDDAHSCSLCKYVCKILCSEIAVQCLG